MIRLIAADMDGTLLNSQKELPRNFFPVMRALAARGVLFVAASGRQYYNLEELFRPIFDHTVFLGENGAFIFFRGKCIFNAAMERPPVGEVLRQIRKVERAYPILCGVRSAYIDFTEPEAVRNIGIYHSRVQQVPDLEAWAEKDDDPIGKIGIFDAAGAEGHSLEILQKFSGTFNVALTEKNWVNMMRPGVNKGSAVGRIRQEFGIAPEECMVFGDYLNDMEMIRSVPNSYAMANGHPALKAAARFEAPSNDEEGVLKIMETLL